MGNPNYSHVINVITYYLFRYPSVPVAIECALDEMDEGENTSDIKEGLSNCLKRINSGENEVDVLLSFAEEIKSPEFRDFALKICDGTTKNKDIGFYVKGIDPREYFNERNNQQKKKKPYRRK